MQLYYKGVQLNSSPGQEVYEKITIIKPEGLAPPFQGGWGPNPPFNEETNKKWIGLRTDGTIADGKRHPAVDVTPPLGSTFYKYEQKIGIETTDFCGNKTIKQVAIFTYSAKSNPDNTWSFEIDQDEPEED